MATVRFSFVVEVVGVGALFVSVVLVVAVQAERNKSQSMIAIRIGVSYMIYILSIGKCCFFAKNTQKIFLYMLIPSGFLGVFFFCIF